jgi:hypothetical protein
MLACRMCRRSLLMMKKHAEGNRWHRERIHSCNRFPMVSREGQPTLASIRIFGPPSRPEPPSDYPEGPIEEAEARARMPTLQRDELMTQS